MQTTKNTSLDNSQKVDRSQQEFQSIEATMYIKEESESIEDLSLLSRYHYANDTAVEVKQENDAMDIKPTPDDMKLYHYESISNIIDETNYFEDFKIEEEITIGEAKVECNSEFEKRRLKSLTDASTIRCTICHIKFEDASQFEKHIKDEHHVQHDPCAEKKCTKANPVEKRCNTEEVECPKCFIICPNKVVLERHSRRKHREKSFQCKECEMEFPNGGNLRYHRIKVHLIPPFSCPNCSQRYRNKHQFYKHVLTHQNMGPTKKLKCPKCPQQFLRLENLETHSKQHNGKKKSA